MFSCMYKQIAMQNTLWFEFIVASVWERGVRCLNNKKEKELKAINEYE